MNGRSSARELLETPGREETAPLLLWTGFYLLCPVGDQNHSGHLAAMR